MGRRMVASLWLLRWQCTHLESIMGRIVDRAGMLHLIPPRAEGWFLTCHRLLRRQRAHLVQDGGPSSHARSPQAAALLPAVEPARKLPALWVHGQVVHCVGCFQRAGELVRPYRRAGESLHWTGAGYCTAGQVSGSCGQVKGTAALVS